MTEAAANLTTDKQPTTTEAGIEPAVEAARELVPLEEPAAMADVLAIARGEIRVDRQRLRSSTDVRLNDLAATLAAAGMPQPAVDAVRGAFSVLYTEMVDTAMAYTEDALAELIDLRGYTVNGFAALGAEGAGFTDEELDGLNKCLAEARAVAASMLQALQSSDVPAEELLPKQSALEAHLADLADCLTLVGDDEMPATEGAP
jgi:hypothetical protein